VRGGERDLGNKKLQMRARILFVDDEAPIRETISLYFKAKGIDVSTAGTGAEAIRMMEETPFNLAILDVRLGQENGLDLLERFKAVHPSLPVIMFTSLGEDLDLLTEALAKGAVGYMNKNESVDILIKEVERALQRATLDTSSV